MSRSIPALDPLGGRAEKTGFIRTESIRLPSSVKPKPSPGRSGEKEEPGITLWAGPKALFINAVFPGIDLEGLQINITGTRLVFSGPLFPETRNPGRRRANRVPTLFRHSVELPYRVDAERADVRKENGLISIVLNKEESLDPNSNACLETSIMNSMKRYFGEFAPADSRSDENRILQSLEKYFSYIGGKEAIPTGGPR